jgi:hypothetical protein
MNEKHIIIIKVVSRQYYDNGNEVDFRPGGSVKTICTYHVHCTRRHAALHGKARRWEATERAPAKSSKKPCSAKYMQMMSN